MKKYQIYQVSGKTEEGRSVKFMSLDFLKENGILEMEGNLCKIDSDLYEKVYEAEYEPNPEASTEVILDYLYRMFQGQKPDGYTGHSLSVSDVIVLDGTAYYVDSIGFEEIDF